MAIQTDVVGLRGQLYENQYVRVDQVQCTKTDMIAEAGVYRSQAAATAGEYPHMVEQFHGAFDLHSELNPWEQAYALLKQRWFEAVDV